MTAAKRMKSTFLKGNSFAEESSYNKLSEQQPEWNQNILIVDDEPEILSIYKDLLSPKSEARKILSSRTHNVIELPQAKNESSSGRFNPLDDQFKFKITLASDVNTALQAVTDLNGRGESFAMGFFDVRLGDRLDGIQLVNEISKTFPDMYSVFVTAYNDRTIESITNLLGSDRVDRWDYINKPFSSAEIIQKARNFVALWNLRKIEAEHTEVLSDLNRKVLESERVTSVAAVARGVAHEFGNLLMQIMGKAEISRNKSAEDMKQALDKIIDASQRAHEILDKFNHLSDSKSHSGFKQKVEVEKVVDEALDLMGHQFHKNSVAINILQKDSIMANLHSTSILQVLVNIFINALHAMGDTGQIDISLRQLTDSFELTIRDHGPGVPDDLLEKITEPFFTTKGSKGTGLGLAISREIIEIDHSGEFKLQNHPDGGLLVTIRIPTTLEVKS